MRNIISEEEALARNFEDMEITWTLMVSLIFKDCLSLDMYSLLQPTKFRLSPFYVHIYILYSNLIIIGLLPGFTLLVLNTLTFQKYVISNMIHVKYIFPD